MKLRIADIDGLAWERSNGLLPAIVQHAQTGAVLMLAYMNREALRTTLAGQRAVFYSRSRQQLWVKGATSGNTLQVLDVRQDCDGDTLLLSALPAGPACHNGTATCFGDDTQSDAERLSFLGELEQIIAGRIAGNPEGSYTAALYARGVRRMAQKVGEEGLEVALAAAGEPDAQLVGESADLLYHLLLLLRARQLRLQDVITELRQRHASRAAQHPKSTSSPAPETGS
jgi:phosphoribosyl-ATP pyrophosphohydrolase/phosphoribosyl-AMP cyclohydrolase